MTPSIIEAHRRIVLAGVTVLALLLAGLAGAEPDGPDAARRAEAGMPTAAGGAFTCDFTLPSDPAFVPEVGPAIERDRMYMAARPGMQFKHIPFAPDERDDRIHSGGRYLFDTEQDARRYFRWVQRRFALDDVLFFDRPEIIDPDCHAWGVVGAHEFEPLERQVALRTERWHAGDGPQPGALLAERWPTLVEEARSRGLAALWLLHDSSQRLVSLVYVAPPATPTATVPGHHGLLPPAPGFAPLVQLTHDPPLGEAFEDQPWTRVYDRAHVVLTTWFPFRAGDQGQAALWPNSPPLPTPHQADGVCSPSRGETHENSLDCLPPCGNGEPDPGETTGNCPSDVRPHWTRGEDV